MTTPISGGNAAQAAAASRPATESGSRVESSRKQLNVQILQASLDVSISAGSDSQQLLFRNAIDKLNEALGPEFGPDAIQAAASQDNSPAGTAGRIVALSTGMFDAYAAQHPDLEPAEQAKRFAELIRGGVDKGFGEARDILSGLKVLEGDIASNIDKTYELVQQGIDAFLAKFTTPAAPADGGAATA